MAPIQYVKELAAYIYTQRHTEERGFSQFVVILGTLIAICIGLGFLNNVVKYNRTADFKCQATFS